MEPDTGNLHSRRWELPQAVINLLNLHSMYAYYSGASGANPCWYVELHNSGTIVAYIALDTPVEHWITHIESVTRNPP